MVVVAAVTLDLCLTVLPALYAHPIPVDWGSPELVYHHPYVDALGVKALVVGDTEYLFALFDDYTDLDSMEGESGSIIRYVTRAADGWSNLTTVRLDHKVNGAFDCVYDGTAREFLIFYRNTNGSTPALYLARGPLDRMSPSQFIVRGNESYMPVEGPYDMSAAIAPDGRVDLVFRYTTGMTENLNAVYLMTYDGTAWSEPELVGVGNSPAAIRGRDGALQLYTNLWTLVDRVQYCVSEWTERGGAWSHHPIETSAQDCNVEPFVIDDARGDRFLVYNHQDCEVGAKTDLLVQMRPRGGGWGPYERIVADVPGYDETPWVHHYGIEGPCATIHGDDFNVYYISHGDVYSVEGRFR